MPVFFELAAVLAVATACAFVAKLLKQPLIIAYIVAGILAGPAALNIVHSHETIELFSKLGITILLFIVGLHLNPRVIKDLGKVSLVTGLGQVLITSSVGFGIALFLGIETVAAMYVAIALTFSSTIIILKLLSDKGDMHSLYGKIAIGFLLVQDIVATIILIFMGSAANAEGVSMSAVILDTFTKGAVFMSGLLLIGKYALPKIAFFSSKSSELLFLFSLTWGFVLAALFQWSGLSIEIGALLGGVTLSVTQFAEEISSRLKPLRDFFIILFFIMLGSQMQVFGIGELIIPVVILSFFVLIGNPIIVVILMNLLGYHRKIGFMAGLTVAQISEFSLILATLGLRSGHLSSDVLTIITLVGLITIAGSSYLILYAEGIYERLDWILRKLEIRSVHAKNGGSGRKLDVLLCGFNRAGPDLYTTFKSMGMKVGIVDIDPTTQDRLPRKNMPFIYGDLTDAEFVADLPVKHATFLVSTVSNHSANLILAKHISVASPDTISIFYAYNAAEEAELYEAGATYVLQPETEATSVLSRFIRRVGDNKESYIRKARVAS